MTNTRINEWRCDRCEEIDRRADRSEFQPAGWVGVAKFSPPLSSEPRSPRVHLCASCAKALDGFLQTLPRAAVSA